MNFVPVALMGIGLLSIAWSYFNFRAGARPILVTDLGTSTEDRAFRASEEKNIFFFLGCFALLLGGCWASLVLLVFEGVPVMLALGFIGHGIVVILGGFLIVISGVLVLLFVFITTYVIRQERYLLPIPFFMWFGLLPLILLMVAQIAGGSLELVSGSNSLLLVQGATSDRMTFQVLGFGPLDWCPWGVTCKSLYAPKDGVVLTIEQLKAYGLGALTVGAMVWVRSKLGF